MTTAVSALAVFSRNALYKSTFYLLTYLLNTTVHWSVPHYPVDDTGSKVQFPRGRVWLRVEYMSHASKSNTFRSLHHQSTCSTQHVCTLHLSAASHCRSPGHTFPGVLDAFHHCLSVTCCHKQYRLATSIYWTLIRPDSSAAEETTVQRYRSLIVIFIILVNISNTCKYVIIFPDYCVYVCY